MPGAALLAIARRLAALLPVIFIVSVLVFVTLRVLPVDPAKMSLPASASIAQVEAKREEMGLNRPIPEQYAIWVTEAMRGNLGTSAIYRMPTAEVVFSRLPATIELAVLALALAIVVGVAGGLALFSLRGTVLEPVGLGLTSMVMALPDFLLSLLLILGLGVLLPLFPVNGRLAPGLATPDITGFLLLDMVLAGDRAGLASALRHMALPVLALGLSFTPLIVRVLHASLVTTWQQSYIRQARLRGLDEGAILFGQALRNAMLPVVVLIGTQFGALFGGTLLVEMIFSYPGIGNLMMRAIQTVDLSVLMTVAMIYCTATLLFNALADAGAWLLNPRLRGEG